MTPELMLECTEAQVRALRAQCDELLREAGRLEAEKALAIADRNTLANALTRIRDDRVPARVRAIVTRAYAEVFG